MAASKLELMLLLNLAGLQIRLDVGTTEGRKGAPPSFQQFLRHCKRFLWFGTCALDVCALLTQTKEKR